ncbi:MAG: squalene synthase HpnC [Thermoguttaceae bacterium]|nr:squalene synthase HpnC [Thermoguttaceae bacterium]
MFTKSKTQPHCKSDHAIEYCRNLARGHYENFTVASWLLPRAYRDPFAVVYAWCRYADDLADETNDPAEAIKKLDQWDQELDWVFSTRPEDGTQHPISVALRSVNARHALPRESFRDLLRAFRQDQTTCSYDTMDELLDYCKYSANPVGRILLALFGTDATPEQLQWSDMICTGLQLANFWQDVCRDTKRGRYYIPKEISRQYTSFEEALRYLVAHTREYFEQGQPLVRSLPFRFRYDIALFYGGGLAVLRKIERGGFRTDRVRPSLSGWDKLSVALRCLTVFLPNLK